LRVLVARAGALGDILLLRRAVVALRRVGHEPIVLAPRETATALVGPGESEVRSALHFDGAWLAEALAGSTRALDALDGIDAALAITRSQPLVDVLSRQIGRVLVQDPLPSGKHASHWYADGLADLCCQTQSDVPPDLEATAEERESASALSFALGDSFLAVHPGSGSSTKNWPEESFGEAIDELAGNKPWLLIRGPAEETIGSQLERRANAVALSCCPTRTLGEILRRARLYVGNDSGISHLAAAWGAPTLTLFGPTDPRLWSPVGRQAREIASPSSSLRDLQVEAVVETGRLLEHRAGRRPTGVLQYASGPHVHPTQEPVEAHGDGTSTHLDGNEPLLPKRV
jgi:heptosyltransferase-3